MFRAFSLILMILTVSHLYANTLATDSNTLPEKFTLLPNKKMIPVYTADGRSHRLSLLKNPQTSELTGSMGGIFPAFDFRVKQTPLQFSVASSLYTTLKKYYDHGKLVNVDFFVDLFLDMRMSKLLYLRLGTGHTSQHLSDDVVNDHLVRNYAKDYHKIYVHIKPENDHYLIYGGMNYNYNFKTTDSSGQQNYSGTPDFQLGFEHAPFTLTKQGRIYYAMDCKFHGELNYGLTWHVQSGVRFMNTDGRALRIAMNYTAGYEERGQFSGEKHNFYNFGVYFDF